MCDVRDQMVDDGFFGGYSRFCSYLLRNWKNDGWMSTEQSLTNADKIITYNFLEETYYTARLLIFFFNEITKISAKTPTKKQEKFKDGKVNNVRSVAPPNETEQKSMIRTLLLRIKEQIQITMMTS